LTAATALRVLPTAACVPAGLATDGRVDLPGAALASVEGLEDLEDVEDVGTLAMRTPFVNRKPHSGRRWRLRL